MSDIEQERAACYEIVFSAGCICDKLVGGGRAVFRGSGHYRSVVQEHDPCCPRALAKLIKVRGDKEALARLLSR